MRVFRHASAGNQRLAKNGAHNFALQHAWKIFSGNAVYTMIPKNGCSSFRYSIALANGCIEGPDHINWINSNNGSFACDTEGAFKADYTFVVLRCPYRRIVSAFYDKIVNLDIQSWQLHNQTHRRVHPHDITFEIFLRYLANIRPPTMNHHWRPQTDFLLYKEYDDVFAVERFDEIGPRLKQSIDFDLIDTRPFVAHDRAVHRDEELHDDKAASMPALELLNLKKQGKIYSESSFLTEENAAAVAKIYAADIELYKGAGFEALLFGRD